MKYVLPLVLAAIVAAATPAMADHDHGRGGGWHGGGEGRGDGGWHGGGGGRWAGGPGGRQGPAGPGDGRWSGGYPAGPESGPAYAAPPDPRRAQDYDRGEQDEVRNGVRSGQIKSMGWILNRLRSRGGHMLDANLGQGPNGEPIYRVVWASPDGRRTDYIIDARTGAILQGY
jgi:hypothetical protein